MASWREKPGQTARELFLSVEQHRMIASIVVIGLLHLGLLFLWPTVIIGQANLTPPPPVVHLTEFNIAIPVQVAKTEKLKIDDRKIEISKRDKPGEKIQKSSSTSTREDFLPFFQADVQPRPLVRIESIMNYPEQARRMNVQATVVVELDIGIEGEVHRAKIVRKAGWGFDEEVLRKITMVRFRPALKDKEPIAVTVLIPLAFRLY